MNLIEAVQWCSENNWLRVMENKGHAITNGKRTYKNFIEFAKAFKLFEEITEETETATGIKTTKTKKIFHNVNDVPDEDYFPVCEFTTDFSKPFGKVNGEPLFNLARMGEQIKPENTGADTSPIWQHFRNLCGNVPEEHVQWFFDWIAQMFQHPSRKPGTAVTIRSAEGTGKGLLCSILNRLMGEEAYYETSGNLFGERFNGSAKNKLLLVLNEGSWENNRGGTGDIKAFITDKTFRFEDKGMMERTLPNFARVIMTTNENWVVKADDSRRFFMLNPLKEEYACTEYFEDLWALVDDNDVMSQLYWEFMNRTITNNLRVVPITEEMKRQGDMSMDYYKSFLKEVLEDEDYMYCGMRFWDKELSGRNNRVVSLSVYKDAFIDYSGMRVTSQKLTAILSGMNNKFGYSFGKIKKATGWYYEFTKHPTKNDDNDDNDKLDRNYDKNENFKNIEKDSKRILDPASLSFCQKVCHSADKNDDPFKHKVFRNISFYKRCFEEVETDCLNECVEEFLYYNGQPATLENKVIMKDHLVENYKTDLFDQFMAVREANEEKRQMLKQMTADLYGSSNKKKRLPNNEGGELAQDLIDGNEVKGQDLYAALKTLHWCNYHIEEVAQIIECLKSQRAKSGDRYMEAKAILTKYWDVWTVKNNK